MRCSGLAGGPDVTGPRAEGLAASAGGAWPGGAQDELPGWRGARPPHQPPDQGGREQARRGGRGACRSALGKVLEEIYSDVLLREGHPSRGSVYKNFPAC